MTLMGYHSWLLYPSCIASQNIRTLYYQIDEDTVNTLDRNKVYFISKQIKM